MAASSPLCEALGVKAPGQGRVVRSSALVGAVDSRHLEHDGQVLEPGLAEHRPQARFADRTSSEVLMAIGAGAEGHQVGRPAAERPLR